MILCVHTRHSGHSKPSAHFHLPATSLSQIQLSPTKKKKTFLTFVSILLLLCHPVGLLRTGFLPELGSKTLWLKTPHILVAEYREIIELSWNITPCSSPDGAGSSYSVDQICMENNTSLP